uniref:Patatin-like phospholipase n=1 Tax=Megaviridae environmental sample TaxID=1737588 RepID=A0A5J6VH03_9VIRU|nr:MAG: patatin-like phospholipase [Megaviridae environmental sample]
MIVLKIIIAIILLIIIWSILLNSALASLPIIPTVGVYVNPYITTTRTNGYKLLSISGGGIKGLGAIIFLERMYHNELQSGDFFSIFDGFCGTSTGAIICAALCGRHIVLQNMLDAGLQRHLKQAAEKYNVYNLYEELLNGVLSNYSKLILVVLKYMYVDYIDIFIHRPLWYHILSLGGMIAPTYYDSKRRDYLHKIFRFRFQDLHQDLHIITQDVKNFNIVNFTNYYRGEKPNIGDNTWVSFAVLASSSAPTYYPCFEGYIDGGIAYYNPVEYVLQQMYYNGITPRVLSIVLETKIDIHINKNAGGIEWIKPLSRLIMRNTIHKAEEFGEMYEGVFGERIVVVNPLANSEHIDMFANDKTDYIINQANSLVFTAEEESIIRSFAL